MRISIGVPITEHMIRHASDYDTFYIASKEITKQQIETAGQLFQLAKEYYERKQSIS